MTMPISQAARATGLTPDTLRYYERIGLLANVARDAGGRRRYASADIERLAFIRRAQQMNFSLAEIRQLLQLRDGDSTDRPAARRLAGAKLEAIRDRIQALQQLERELGSLIDCCRHAADGRDCPIIAGIQGQPAAAQQKRQ